MQETFVIDVLVNGERRQVRRGCSVSQLLGDLEIAPERVAVEMNGTIVRKRDWPATLVAEESCLEIVEFVGGG